MIGVIIIAMAPTPVSPSLKWTKNLQDYYSKFSMSKEFTRKKYMMQMVREATENY